MNFFNGICFNNMEIEKYLKENYPDLGEIRKIEPLGHNNINSTNYFILTNKGKYVLRNFTDGSSSEKIEKICQILLFCLQNGVKVSESIKRKEGNFVDRKRNIYLTKYYEGNLYQGTILELKEAAKNLAILHSVLSRTPVKYNYRLNQNYYRHLTPSELKKIKALASKKRNLFDKKVLKNFNDLAKAFLEERKVDLKDRQLIHYDFHPQNVVFNKNKVATILDFNAMRKGLKVEDLAFASFRFSSYKIDNSNQIKKRLKLFVDNYLSYNYIEKDRIGDLNYYFTSMVLNRLAYILKKRYFANSNLWSIDFEKQINFLKLARKLSNLTK